ncbi:uncharacterized protein L3040_001413 [Drepanopeziza brunnea f. sp. 'multigermtubi']|uniref:Microcystin LR degradation protein MlrC n=1 Tax=Marssonina brunnea f. sp. multigermtubi (strain MB_m1) TaxID=1072389 RepID=K1XVI1_MARBU|nr:uncharacterized protein MBM_05143 [Drepanopeziza brunnea f. sp. 'multigermtubi' MB_m1]EKD16674.1 hypothetical protein MBM_05143 [Drepanopeziza brunnea f. sp. 'multigermtubi' MB_m1]KAJ5051638.1 hypothetical protein L3040_001413 [Drepanopeziza brunnea f. sp. 'multigermtubi']
MTRKPVIAVAGLACETSTFTPSRTLAPAFHPKLGDREIFAKHTFIAPGTALGSTAEWHGALIGHALPGGAVTRAAYEELAGEIVARLTRIVVDVGGPLDGLWFDIHGAMCVEGIDDVEAELLGRIREVVGKDVVVSASLDLHGNVSRELVHRVDLITCYRTAPHVDVVETRKRACRNLVDVLDRSAGLKRPLRPFKAWIPIPILLPGEQTSTRLEPAKHIYEAVREVEAMDGIIDAAVWVGYAWADEPRSRAAVVATGWDEAAASRGAEKLAKMFWAAHKDFAFVAPTGSFKECLDAALVKGARHPYFISDSGDNPTAGGSGDVSWGLTQLLARTEFKEPSGPTVIYASLPGPEAVRIAVEAGIGATVTVTAGAEIDNLHAGPVTMTGKVHSIKYGDKDAVVEVVIHTGSVFAILTRLRKPYHHESDFTELNLMPRSADIVIVKIGYLEPELYDMAADWMLGLTPGGVDQDIVRLGHRRIRRPMWPFDKKFDPSPDLRARVISPSDEVLEGPDE